MGLFFASPAYLLGFAALRGYGRSRLVTGAALAVLLVAVVNLMHFSQGWVQFGYRFSNDFAPFALLLVAIGFERLARRHRLGDAARDGARRRLHRGRLLGRRLGETARMVTRLARFAPLLVGDRRVRGRPHWRCCPAWRSGTPASTRRSGR